jgi:hypothetical protein
MFTWICPQCGREVPPAYTECPDCAAKAAGAAPPAPPPAPPQQPLYQPPPVQAGMPVPPQPYPPYPPQQQYPPYAPQQQYPPYAQNPQYPPPPYQQPPQPPYQQPQQPAFQQPVYQQPAYQQPVYQQPQYQPPPPPPPPPPLAAAPPPPPSAPVPIAEPLAVSTLPPVHSAPGMSSLFGAPEPPPQKGFSGLPTWLLTIICTAGFVAVVAFGYWLMGSHSSTTAVANVESPAARPGASTNPWQKFIEVSGLRLVEDPKNKGKILAKFIVTNHSSGDLTGLAGNVTIWASTKRSEEDAQGTFSFITDVPAYGYKEITTPLTTKLKVYELPDWQNVTNDLQITAPSAGGSGGLQ